MELLVWYILIECQHISQLFIPYFFYFYATQVGVLKYLIETWFEKQDKLE